MIRRGFLAAESRHDLIKLTRDGSAAHRLSRRANALVLLDDAMSCAAIAKVLFVDDDTIRDWYQRYQEDGGRGPDQLRPRRGRAGYPSSSGTS